MKAIWRSIIADALKGDKTARKYVVEFMMPLNKLDFEDDGVYFHRITKERQKAIDDLLDQFGQYEIKPDSNQKQGNGSSSGGVDNQGQGNGSSSGGVDNQGQGNSSSSGAVVWIE